GSASRAKAPCRRAPRLVRGRSTGGRWRGDRCRSPASEFACPTSVLLLLLPSVVFFRRHRDQRAAHLAVAESAEFGAGNLVCAWSADMQFQRDLHPGHDVLLGAQFAYEEVVNHVARMKQQQNIPTSGDAQAGGHDVIFAGRIFFIVNDAVSTGVADELDAGASKLAIRTGITEGPRELVCVDFDNLLAGLADRNLRPAARAGQV